MFLKRMIVNIFLVPGMMLMAYIGGLPFSIFFAFSLGVAAWEYHRIFKNGGYSPSLIILIAGVVILALRFSLQPHVDSDILVSMTVLAAMTVHVIAYERGIKTAATDFCITLAGILYLGWLGSYLSAFHTLADGQWWLLLVLLCVWVADSGAYIIGKKFGKHFMSPRVSPKKTWEGYFGGIVFCCLASLLVGLLFSVLAPAITPLRALLLGSLISVMTPMGDLGESIIKRQFDVKDSSQILPGIGGIMDRVDSWLWAAVISFFVISILWL